MDIRPIYNDSDHERAVARIDALFDAEPGTPEHDELDVLATLVDAYEAEHHPVDPPTPVEAIRFRLEQGDLTRAELAELLGSRAKVAEVLGKQRALSKVMIVRLHERLGIAYEVLLGDVKTKRKRKRKAA
jgi:HTH-type transcriptional regulator / antitoxin HigA